MNEPLSKRKCSSHIQFHSQGWQQPKLLREIGLNCGLQSVPTNEIKTTYHRN